MTRWTRRGGTLLAILALLSGSALAQQQPVTTTPSPATTKGSNASATISSTGVFQQVWAATCGISSGGASLPCRKGCTIQNLGTHDMYVSEGQTIAASTTTNTVTVIPKGAYYCQFGGMVLTGIINITGTAGDAFYAAQE